MGAVQYLLQRQRSRDNLEMRAWLAAYAGCLLVGVFTWWFSGVMIPVMAFSALVVLPALRGLYDGSTLYSLLAGGAYAEIRQTRLAHREMVDGLALQGLLFQVRWAALPGLALMLWSGLWGLLWFGLMLGLTLLASYGCLAEVARRHGRAGFPSGSFCLLGFCLLPWQLGVLPLWAGLVMLARHVAILGLAEADRLAPHAGVRVTRAMRWIPWSENAIVGRECARESNSIGRSWWSVGWHFFGVGILATLGLVSFVHSRVSVRDLMLFVLVFGVLQALRAAFRVSLALSEERDRRTLDVLLLSSLDAGDFVQGWAEVGYRPRQLEAFWVTVMALFLSSPYVSSPYLLAMSGLVSMLVCAAGAYLGLFLGFRSCMKVRSWRDALAPLAVIGWGLGTYPLLPLGLGYLVLQGLAAGLLLLWARRRSAEALMGR